MYSNNSNSIKQLLNPVRNIKKKQNQVEFKLLNPRNMLKKLIYQ